jgi:hypothetical protein
VRAPLQFSPCELLLLEAGSLGRGTVWEAEEGECLLLEAVTRKLVKKQQAEKT